MTQNINYRHDLRVRCQPFLLLYRYEGPQLVHVDDWAPLQIAREMESAHTDFTEVTGMVFIEVGSMEQTQNVNILVSLIDVYMEID
jgi:hypothetical protein